MVSTIMHTLYGIMVALSLKLNLPLFLIFTNLPDLDGITDIFNDKIKYHGYVLHNIFAFFLILIIGSIFFNFKLMFIALVLHFLLDILNDKIPFFFPLSKELYGLYLLKKDKKKSLWTFIFYEQSIFFTIISLIVFIIFLLFYFF